MLQLTTGYRRRRPDAPPPRNPPPALRREPCRARITNTSNEPRGVTVKPSPPVEFPLANPLRMTNRASLRERQTKPSWRNRGSSRRSSRRMLNAESFDERRLSRARGEFSSLGSAKKVGPVLVTTQLLPKDSRTDPASRFFPPGFRALRRVFSIQEAGVRAQPSGRQAPDVRSKKNS